VEESRICPPPERTIRRSSYSETASIDQDGKPLGGVAQLAMQQGRYAARLISSDAASRITRCGRYHRECGRYHRE
jgi:hypothetical protein